MTHSFPELAEMRSLLDALCEDTITMDQVRRLEELVLARPEAEAYYVQYMSLYADLVSQFGALPAKIEQSLRGRAATAPAPPQRKPLAAPHRSHLIIGGILGLAAVAAAAVFLFLLRPAPPEATPGEQAEATDDSVALLLRTSAARWDEAASPSSPTASKRGGAPLAPGWLRLKSGLAQIEFYSGAALILEGPAELKLISRMEAFCPRGKLRATVPPQAQGFKILTPQLEIVDQGTEFGLLVGAGNRTEVHVFQGKVDLYEKGRQAPPPRRELTTGQGVRFDDRGVVKQTGASPTSFKTAQDLADEDTAEARRIQQRWLAASAALRRDPSLVVYYTFQDAQPWSRTLLDQARDRKDPHDGAIVGCSWVTGRWSGKQALELRGVSDRIRLHLSGQLDAMTLATWVRVDALPNQLHSLFMTDGWEEAAPHWHISKKGRIELGVQGWYRRGGVHYYSPTVITADRLGHWLHLAVVYDRKGGQVLHYVDGRPVSRESLKLDIPLLLGDAEIGNWNIGSRSHNHPIRYLSGCIDEFMLFSRALGADEVERLYGQGRPPF
jgi:hypothetical protein